MRGPVERLTPLWSILAAESALRSHPCVAVPSAQISIPYQDVRSGRKSKRTIDHKAIVHVLWAQLTARHILAWCAERKITMNYIQPGKPVQNGHIESLNGRLRDECLNVNWFGNLFDARRKISLWRQDYNAAQPHSSLELSNTG